MSQSKPPRILAVGKDARTDVMVAACQKSSSHAELFAFAEMLNPGLERRCNEVYVGSLTSPQEQAEVLRKCRPDLVLIGPEEPLAHGFVDRLEEAGIPAFGPSKALAAIESSKSWARSILERYDIPGNPGYRVFDSESGLLDYMEDLGEFVIKPDGLTAGKGVRVFGEHLSSIGEALGYATDVLRSHGRVQIEEKLEGEEFSLQTITDGSTVVHCPLVQDHKRAFEGDSGPNTGGMGSYSCEDFSLPFLDQHDVSAAQSINERVIDALAREVGRPYKGVLYGGFMATANGVKLIEYNARFGDPEAMNVLSILDADFVEICDAVAHERLGDVPVCFSSQATVCKYVVPAAYPEVTERPGGISVPDLPLSEDADWYWAACKSVGDTTVMTGSRSGAVLGVGSTLREAEEAAEAGTFQVHGNVRHRRDIGRPEVIQSRIAHMRSLRSKSADIPAPS